MFHQDHDFLEQTHKRVNQHDGTLGTSQQEMAQHYSDFVHLPFDLVAFPHTCRCGDDFADPNSWHLVHFTWGVVKPSKLWIDAKFDIDRFVLCVLRCVLYRVLFL